MTSVLLQRATTLDPAGRPAAVSDVRIVDGTITALGDLGPADGDDVVDLDGYLLLQAAVEPHAHLDKAFLAERITNPTGDLMGAIEAMREHRHLLAVDETIERAERAARLMAANGFRSVRTHADTTVEHGLCSIEALAAVKQRVADVIDVEIVALCGWPVVGRDTEPQRQLLVDALAAGADLVGGCPHLEDGESWRATEFFLQTAADHGVGVDLHTDETLDPESQDLADLAAIVGSGGFPYPVTASHCVSLAMRPESDQRAVAESVAAAGIGVVALPHTNLYLQGRGMQPMPRGLTAIAALRAAGVRVAAGADNLQDPFNPVGRACPFETAALMVLCAHLAPADAWATVADVAAEVTGAPPVTIAVGAQADLVAVRAATLREAIAFGPVDRIVWRRGRRL